MSELIGPPLGAPPKPAAGTCATCGKVVEAVWIPGIEKPRWWVPSLCADCLAAAQGVRRQQQEAEAHSAWLRERIERAGLGGVRRLQTFAVFRPVPGTRGALAAAQQFAKVCAGEALPSRGLLFVGENGSGKTLLATAVLNYVLEENHTLSALLVRFSDYLLKLRAAFGNRDDVMRAMDLRQVMATVDLLVMDDLGAAAMTRSEWDSEELARVLEDRDLAGLPILATCDLSGAELERRLGRRIVSRLFGMCRVVPMADGPVEAADYRRREQ